MHVPVVLVTNRLTFGQANTRIMVKLHGAFVLPSKRLLGLRSGI